MITRLIAFLILCASGLMLQGCDEIIADEMPGAAQSGDLTVHLGGCGYVLNGLIKCSPNVGTSTATLSFQVSAPKKEQLQCSSYSCVKVEIRDGNQTLATKWVPPLSHEVSFNFFELLGEAQFVERHSSLLGVSVTVFYKLDDKEKDLEAVYDGEVRLKPIASGYRPLSPGDKYTAAKWDCFGKRFECGLSTRGRSYLVQKK